MGAEKFSLYYMEEAGHSLERIATEGLDGAEANAVDIIDLTVARGAAIIKDEAEVVTDTGGTEPIACIPLKFQDMHLGAGRMHIMNLYQWKRIKI